jgi:catechol 2,3-dioxygenase-like lactoylglutathione lyase family enzyme
MSYSGIHHLGLYTNDMKAQIEFFTQVLGFKLSAILDFHSPTTSGVICFIEVSEDCYVTFLHSPGVHVDAIEGVSHAADFESPVAGGGMQHLAIGMTTQAALLDARDRLRSNGYAVFGPMGHGMSDSLYFSGPEGLLLELTTKEGFEPVTPEMWINAKAGAMVGLSEEDLARYMSPDAFAGQGGAVPQPDLASAVYPKPIPRSLFDAFGYVSDEEIRSKLSFKAPNAEKMAGAAV